jgi:hypothetical protein
MLSSLDKLKALSSRLENKIEEKTKVEPEPEPLASDVLKKVDSEIVIEEKKVESKKVLHTRNNEVRESNILRVKKLYRKLGIDEKSPNFDAIFEYKAMNLSGIGLKENDFAQVRNGKYIQIIAITYEADASGKKKAKNISLGYFGKAENLEQDVKNDIIEFVLRWRYEKTFQNVSHYKALIDRIDTM